METATRETSVTRPSGPASTTPSGSASRTSCARGPGMDATLSRTARRAQAGREPSATPMGTGGSGGVLLEADHGHVARPVSGDVEGQVETRHGGVAREAVHVAGQPLGGRVDDVEPLVHPQHLTEDGGEDVEHL